MSRFQKLKNLRKQRLHREGTEILIISAILLLGLNGMIYWGCGLNLLFYIIAAISITLYLLMVNFFRCPIRHFEQDSEKIVVAPADGKIVVVQEVNEMEYFHDRRLMISIFMDVTNVHANWYPVDGVVKHVSHQNGKFMKAWLPKASTENERSTVLIEAPNKQTVLLRQVAGALARRIVTYAKEGMECHRNEQSVYRHGSHFVFLHLFCHICYNPSAFLHPFDYTTERKT